MLIIEQFILLKSELVFQGNLQDQFFGRGKRHKFENTKKLPLQTLLFSCLKFVSRWVRRAVKIMEDFTEGNSRKSQIKPYSKKSKKHCLYINFNALRNHATTNKIYREIEVRTWYIKILN